MDGVEMFDYIGRFVPHTQISKKWKQKMEAKINHNHDNRFINNRPTKY